MSALPDFQRIVDFIRELYEQPEGMIPLHAPIFRGREKEYLAECIDSTFVSSVGRFVDVFEKQMTDYTGARKAVACVNGSSALVLALQLAGVEAGDEVLTQPLTFVATANAIAHSRALPVFLDVDKDTLGLSAEALEAFLEENAEPREGACRDRRTGRPIKACLPMHAFGHPCRIDRIVELCARHAVAVVEDAAEGIGSLYKGRHTGTFGPIGVLSFNGNKTITTGGGGMLLFQDESLGKAAKHLTTQARIPHPWTYDHDRVGYNYRLPNINAALGVAQMEQIAPFLESKRRTAQAYARFFDSLGIPFVREPQDSRSNYWLNVILLEDREARDEFLGFSNSRQVTTRPIWRLMHELPMYSSCPRDSLSNAVWLADRGVCLPSSARP